MQPLITHHPLPDGCSSSLRSESSRNRGTITRRQGPSLQVTGSAEGGVSSTMRASIRISQKIFSVASNLVFSGN